MTAGTWWLLSSLVGPAWSAAPSADHRLDTLTGPIAGELEAYRAAQVRFSERMRELEADTRSYVAVSERTAREAVDARFRDRIGGLQTRGADQRAAAISQFEGFLQKYPTLPYADHVRFRLAELWFEDATEDWLAAQQAYEAAGDDAAPEPKRDLSRALSLYRSIIEQNAARPASQRYERLDGAYLMLAFCYMDANSVQHDEGAAQHAFLDLIGQVPDSDLADRAHLYLGNFAFEKNDFERALAEYTLVVSKGADGKYYEEALYQLAWARYKLDQFQDALALFTQLLDHSVAREQEVGQESAFAPDARRFVAFSLADISYDDDRDAAAVAKEFFGDRHPAYERQVYEQLSDVLTRYTRPREAIAVNEHLQTDPRWVNEPDNPSLQVATIGLYLDSVARDLEAAGRARLAFIERYGEGTPWWTANRNNPEALGVARSFIESSLLEVAVEYRVQAQETGSVDDYALAAGKYREYLERFPIADDYYEQQWYLADSLKLAQQWDAARVEYDALVRSGENHPYEDGAVYALMDIELQSMLAAGHAPELPPADAPVERTYTAGGAEIPVFALSPDRAAFVAAADRVLAHTFAPFEPGAELPDFAVEVEKRRPSIEYIIGQILFEHHRYDEARARFLRVVDGYPRSQEAAFAAGLLVDSYLAEGDLEQVRSYSKRFTVDPPGPIATVDTGRFSGTLEGTTFKLAMEDADRGNSLAAAQKFLAFGEEFPTSPLAPDALYNAAFYHQQVGQAERANALYEQFVAKYPRDERAKGLFFRIAANYESTFDLERAVAFYDEVLRHPAATPAEKADALYNRSFLQIGLGNGREAAQGFERYEAQYPRQADREKVLFLAGEQWEQIGDAEARSFYERYLKKYPTENPDHALQAAHRLAELASRTGASAAKVRGLHAAVGAAYDRFVKSGAEIGPKGQDEAARSGLVAVRDEFDALAAQRLTGNDARDAATLEAAQGKLAKFDRTVQAFVGKYQSFDANAEALLLQARAALALADLGLSIRCPANMSEEDCWVFEDVLQENVFPTYYAVEEVGLQRLQELVKGAAEKKRHSAAIDEAMAELNRRRPADFPAVKPEIQGELRSLSGVEPAPRGLPGAEGSQP